MDGFDLLYAMSGLLLGGICTYISMKKALGEARQAAAAAEKTIAERDKLIEERDSVIAQTQKTLAETKSISLADSKARLEIQAKQSELQKQLTTESDAYRSENEELSDLIIEMTLKIADNEDASGRRNAAIRQLFSGVLPAFSRYIDQAKIIYSEAESDVVAVVLEGEVANFLIALDETQEVLNSSEVLLACSAASQPLQITLASLNGVKVALTELKRNMAEDDWKLVRRAVRKSSLGKLMIK